MSLIETTHIEEINNLFQEETYTNNKCNSILSLTDSNCISDNNDNSLNVSGVQKQNEIQEFHCANTISTNNKNNEMRRKNLLLNMIDCIMNYLSQSSLSSDADKENCNATIDGINSEDCGIKMKLDTHSNCCDNSYKEMNGNTNVEEEKNLREYEFSCLRENSTEIATEIKTRIQVVPKNISMSVTLSSTSNRMRIAFGVLIRLLLPVANKFSRGWNGLKAEGFLRLINKIRHTKGLLTTLLAFAANTVSMSLSSVQVSNRIDPLLRAIKLRRTQSLISTPIHNSINLVRSHSTIETLDLAIPRTLSLAHLREDPIAKCVNLVMLAEPPPGELITVDVIFIHGLHGSLQNTWKQGLWKSEGRLEGFNRPPKPPIRPPKRQRHSRSTLVVPSRKRARYSDDFEIRREQNDTFELKHKSQIVDTNGRTYTYECSDPDDIQYIDDVEYSFPTFKLRIDDIEINETVKLERQQRDSNASKNDSYSKCWPGDWLPLDCPGVRVIAINYTTDPYLWRPVWVKKRNRSCLADRAREMQDLLIEKGVGNGRPIVWVGHSKGGIFIKQLIVDAWESGRVAAKNLYSSSRGCFFYSVPHRGSSLADFNLPFLRQSTELTEIQKNCASILDLHGRFVALYRAGHLKINVFSFIETALTLMSVLYLRIVTIDSADPGIGEVCGVHLDHREICKPRGRDCVLYTQLVNMIKNCKY